MRVFLGLVEIAGYYGALKQGFTTLGVPCTFINLTPHRFQYTGADETPLSRAIVYAASQKGKLWRWAERLLRWTLLFWAMATHDVFIFGCGVTFLKDQRDLPWLKSFGKTVICQFHGSDSRPPYLDGSAMAADRGRSIADCIAMTARKKAMIDRVDRFADLIVDTPPQGHFHTRPFVLWLAVGLPGQPVGVPQDVPPPVASRTEGPIRLLHCPSHPAAKGTDQIRAAVARLQAEGLSLELVEVIGQPHRVVLAELARCDVVIDQLYADYGMPGFATEAAWFGKPVIIGGYAVDLWAERLAPDQIPPTHYCHPEAVESAIRQLVTDPTYRQALGQRAYDFVRQRWAPHQIAQRYLDCLAGQVPESWWFDPNTITYWQGCCLPEAGARRLIGQVLAQGGPEALQLEDKPALRALMQSVADQGVTDAAAAERASCAGA
jgi:hypothetical protein